MLELKLPSRFLEKLKTSDKKFKAIIYDILKNFEDILNTSTLDFFPEYNNHGITHLNNVFNIQDELITDESFNLLTAEDITTLVVATLSHDIGMHLNYEGFQTLLESSDLWRERWNTFFQRATKYNQARLEQLFGDSNPVIELPTTKQDFRSRDYMLVGEFLRTNHPAMAEDILNQGFPIANGEFKKLTDLLDDEKKILDFSALLAKSHGMNIRSTFNEIESIGYIDNLVFSHNVHIVYLMVVLRLSDYMDIYKNRHPKVMLGIKNFMSEISQFEWDKNTAIIDENPYHKDKDAIFLGVEPQNSTTFIDLQKLFKGIQYELDISWAVLGEVYSRDDDLKNFAIKHRRIRTNIDDIKSFSKKIDYLPRSISFDSDPELLKLLIAPLYGDNPSYGVRELLQNAVDACKELKELRLTPDYEPKISVDSFKEEEKYFFKIKDNGVGMTESIIVDYFLKAGASFRNSDAWKEKFEDSEHKSKVERTGRFGVGLLASFLIGSKIEVETKHHTLNEGYIFKTKLSDSQINVIKNKDCCEGTTIKIEMTEERFKKLENSNWKDWYKLSDTPITFNKQEIENTINEDQYSELKQNEYSSVKWCFAEQNSSDLICNGFVIPSGELDLISEIDIPSSIETNYSDRIDKYFNDPSLLIIDKEGKLPLDLSRVKLISNEFTFQAELIKAMSRKFFEGLSLEKLNRNILKTRFFHPMHSDDSWKRRNYTKLLYSKDGYNLLSSYAIHENYLDRVVFICFKTKTNEYNIDKRNSFISSLIDTGISIVLSDNDIRPNSYGYSSWFNTLGEHRPILETDKKFFINSAIINMPRNAYRKVFDYKKSYVKANLKDNLVTSNKDIKSTKGLIPYSERSELWVRSHFKSQTESVFNLKALDELEEEIGLIIELNIDSSKPEERDVEYYFYNLMEEHFKDKDSNWFPYSEEVGTE